MKSSRIVEYFDALILKIQGRYSLRNYQAAFHLKYSQCPKSLLVPEIQTPVYDSCLTLEGCMVKSEALS